MLSSINALRWVRNIDRQVRCISISSTRFSQGESSDGEDDRKGKAAAKLNSLLQSIIKDESLTKEDSTVRTEGPRPWLREKRVKERRERNLGERIVHAAEKVAKDIGGDQIRNEAELLHKVVQKDGILQKSVLRASRNSTLSLLLSELAVDKEQTKPPPRSYSKNEPNMDYSRADLIRSEHGGPPRRPWKPRDFSQSSFQAQSFDLSKEKPLGIFSSVDEYKPGPELPTWDQCEARELKIAFSHPPRNIWEQMIRWTDQGKLWKFPIDNEQGLEKEQEVSFVDHVFLELHLEGWCPQRGPIRHFMELVCVGLSRNHWLSADEKKDHIMWYKDYFLSKKELIHELGAGEIVDSPQASLTP